MSSMRASDDDREKVAARLHQAASEGRIFAHELEDRLATALRAKTYGELEDVVADLPGTPVSGRTVTRSRSRSLITSSPVAVVAVLVAFTVVAAVLAAVAFIASGAWIVFLVFGLIMRGRYGRYHHRRGGPRGGQQRGSAGVQVHVHRYLP
jgi:Flp pilus assembly protein TadB